MEKITEASSVYEQLDQMSTLELLNGINEQDQQVAHAVALVIPLILLMLKIKGIYLKR